MNTGPFWLSLLARWSTKCSSPSSFWPTSTLNLDFSSWASSFLCGGDWSKEEYNWWVLGRWGCWVPKCHTAAAPASRKITKNIRNLAPFRLPFTALPAASVDPPYIFIILSHEHKSKPISLPLNWKVAWRDKLVGGVCVGQVWRGLVWVTIKKWRMIMDAEWIRKSGSFLLLLLRGSHDDPFLSLYAHQAQLCCLVITHSHHLHELTVSL